MARRKKLLYKQLEKIVEAVRRSYPDREVSSKWLEGLEVHDTLFVFLINEVKDVYDPKAPFKENKAEAIRAIKVAANDILEVVKGLESLKA